MSLIGLLGTGFGPTSIGGAAPAVPTLAVVDNEDGTATATISDGSSDASHTVYTARLDGTFDADGWTGSGSRVGNGTASLSLDNGVYWAYVVAERNSQSVESTPELFRVSDGTESVLERILTAVQSRIVALSLSGISSANIQIRDQVDDKNLTLPGVIIVHRNLRTAGGTVNRDDYGYPIFVAVLDKRQAVESDRTRHLLWEERIRRAFNQARLSTVPEQYTCAVEPIAIADPGAWFQGATLVDAMHLVFTTREQRGIA